MMRLAELTPLTAAALVCLAGCGTKHTTATRADATPIEASSFRDTTQPAPAPKTAQVARATTEEPKPAADTLALVGGPEDAVPVSNDAAVRDASTRTSNVPDRLIVDRMVGQINGKPIYASEFFSSMDARLRAEAAKLPPREWLAFVSEQIDQEIADRLTNELLLAEFQSALSPEERQGVLGFLSYLRESLRRQSGGSEATANERLLKTEGITLDEKIEQQKEQQFIYEQVRREIKSRVNVSYRDIKQRYERDAEQYSTEPAATLRVIRVRADDTEAIDAVTAALAAGEPVAEIAGEYGRFKREELGLERVPLGDTPYASAKLFDPPELNTPAQDLVVGQTTAPIEYRGSIWWLHLESLTDGKQTSLYDMQLTIESQIRAERESEERRKYFFELLKNGSFSDSTAMKRELIEFAAERYLIVLPQLDELLGESGES